MKRTQHLGSIPKAMFPMLSVVNLWSHSLISKLTGDSASLSKISTNLLLLSSENSYIIFIFPDENIGVSLARRSFQSCPSRVKRLNKLNKYFRVKITKVP